ncbi:MAG: electron transfer flavoprotein subunit beta/FixA family protein, partial [SAR324 cluster bacterium]|nr:electron transfer flavoprotein subunit beta/FixA family protein [SAR324 cluster bacterium]
MKIAVLLKQVPDLAEELEVDDSGKALDTEYIKFRLNEYDEHALEEAVCLKEAGEATEVTAIALDGEEVDKALFTAMAKGADKALKLTGAEAEGSRNAAALFSEALGSEYDL